VIVMNAPLGNSITTAEHTIALLMALARDLPAANASTQSGRWEKDRFVGTELYGKTLGLIGAGNIGAIVADRAQGLKMRVIAYDPYLPHERATHLGIEKAELDDLLGRSDFVSLHVPLTPETRNIISADAIARMKKGARLINCARGGLVDEQALKAALDSGHLKGATDFGFSPDRRDCECAQFACYQRAGCASCSAVDHACRTARRFCRPAHPNRYFVCTHCL
jgi:D-3-phosphoglycerate dehydrogenase